MSSVNENVLPLPSDQDSDRTQCLVRKNSKRRRRASQRNSDKHQRHVHKDRAAVRVAAHSRLATPVRVARRRFIRRSRSIRIETCRCHSHKALIRSPTVGDPSSLTSTHTYNLTAKTIEARLSEKTKAMSSRTCSGTCVRWRSWNSPTLTICRSSKTVLRPF